MAKIHPTATVASSVTLADDVEVGPGCVLSGNVTIGAGTVLRGMVWVEGNTTIGAGNTFFPNASIGCQPQDWRSNPADPTQLIIGDHCVFRENVTIHRGTTAGGGITRIGNNCMIMVSSHVGHDATIEDRVTLINNVTIAGHCRVQAGCWLSGYCGLHQFTTVGTMAFFGAFAGSDRDVPPFARIEGTRPTICVGVNVVGLRRLGVGVEVIREVRQTLERLYPQQIVDHVDRDALAELDAQANLCEQARTVVEFVKKATAHRFGRQHEAGRFAAAAESEH